MKICSKKKVVGSQEKPQPIPGHVYRLKKQTSRGRAYNSSLLLAVRDRRSSGAPSFLVILTTGGFWSKGTGFGDIYKPEDFEDVTDKVCIDTSELEQ